MIPIINSKRQYETIAKEAESAVLYVMRSGSYILGQNCKNFETEIADFTGAKFAAGLNSGTDALHLALRALDIGAGDEVISVAFTFVATTEAIGIVGAKPVFVDIDPDTYNIDAKKIEEKITPKTKAIIPVSLYGQPCDMDEINQIAKKYKLKVIVDGAQSFGSTYKGISDSNLCDISCTSFFPAKPLGCYGDGGAVFTNNQQLT